jgi:lysophospholipase L1-like esterase
VNSKSKRWFEILVAPFLIVIVMEILLQAGALVMQSNVRERPRNWLTEDTRLIALGDSNTFGLYLEPDESYPAQLERQWNAIYPSDSIEVVNLGYPGVSSFRMLDNFESMMQKFRPDVVLLNVGVNDFFSPVESIESEGDSILARLVHAVRAHSRLYHLVHIFRQSRNEPTHVAIENRKIEWVDGWYERLSRMLEFKKANEKDDQREVLKVDGEEFVVFTQGTAADTIDHLQDNLAKIVEISTRYDVDLYLLTYAASTSFYARSNTELRDFANKSHINFIDVAREMRRHCPVRDQCPEFFFEDFHPNAAGYRMIADFVLTRLSADWMLTD